MTDNNKKIKGERRKRKSNYSCGKKKRLKHKIPTGFLRNTEVQLGTREVERSLTFVRADSQTLVDVVAGEEGPRLRVHHRKLLPVSAQNTG